MEGVFPIWTRSHYSKQHSHSPFQASIPSFTRKYTIMSPTTGSVHHHPINALRIRPIRSAPERYQHARVSFESAIRLRLFNCMPVLYFITYSIGIIMSDSIVIANPRILVCGTSCKTSLLMELYKT